MGFPRKMLMVAVATAAPTTEALKLKKTSTSVMNTVAKKAVGGSGATATPADLLPPEQLSAMAQEKGVSLEVRKEMDPKLGRNLRNMTPECQEELRVFTEAKEFPSDSKIQAFMEKCISVENHAAFKKLAQDVKDATAQGSGEEIKNTASGKNDGAEDKSSTSC